MSEKAIEPYQVVKPVVTIQQAKEGYEEFEQLKSTILKPDDYQAIAGKKYIKRSGFRKLGVCFNLSDRIIEQERTDREDGSLMWRIVVEATAPNGRVVTGVGICDSKERSFAHLEHDVYATAHTRAKNRAFSDMMAGGAVSAEEMEGNPKVQPPKKKGNPEPEDAVYDALASASLDTDLVDIYLYGRHVRVEPKEELADQWTRYNSALQQIGASWIGEQGRWEI